MPRSKNEWSYTSTPNTPSWRGAQLKHRGKFTFTLIIIIIIIITTTTTTTTTIITTTTLVEKQQKRLCRQNSLD
jgi:hypothetical protein